MINANRTDYATPAVHHKTASVSICFAVFMHCWLLGEGPVPAAAASLARCAKVRRNALSPDTGARLPCSAGWLADVSEACAAASFVSMAAGPLRAGPRICRVHQSVTAAHLNCRLPLCRPPTGSVQYFQASQASTNCIRLFREVCDCDGYDKSVWGAAVLRLRRIHVPLPQHV